MLFLVAHGIYVGGYDIRAVHHRVSHTANRRRDIANPRNPGVCHTPLRRCIFLIDCCLCIFVAYCIRPLHRRIKRTANRRRDIANPRNSGVCHTPLQRCNLLTLHRRTSRATNLYRDIANPRNPGVCHTPLRRCIFLIDCCLCIFVAYCIRPLHRRVKRFVQARQ